MAHYAFIENEIVVDVITGIDETELIDGLTPEIFYSNFRGLQCVRTSRNNRIRKQYAGIGYRYDSNADVFIAPQPYPSWSLDENFDWQPPSPKPAENYYWDENSLTWCEIV